LNLYKTNKMKKVITASALVFINAFGFSQISAPKKDSPSTVVGKISPMGSFIAELSYRLNSVEAADSIYTLRFRNAKYKTMTELESLDFSSSGNTVSQFYTALKSVFLDENKSNKDYAITFTLGKDVVAVSAYRSVGVLMVMFQKGDGHFFLTEKQLDKLFGKQ